MNPFYHPATPAAPRSLHRFDHERDNCGMGAIANLRGRASHQVLEFAIESVCNMTHRGAVDADRKTGDGSGVLTQIPRKLFARILGQLGTPIPDPADLAVGVFFLPRDDDAAATGVRALAEQVAARRGIPCLGWREVPVDPDALGALAQATCPRIEHLLLRRPGDWEPDHFERQLYLVRRELELAHRETPGVYIPSLSHRLISYKALAMPAALRAFYADLHDPEFETAIALYHQRFSTNTFPAWPLGQPFRMLCHNGEINTIRGNRNWMASREKFFASPLWGDDVKLLRNLLSHHESDSASLDHALELLVLSGRPPEHAMCMLVPPAHAHDEEISDDLRAFYQFHRSFCEPWDGPSGLVFTDGTRICASLDRNGLRPSRFKLTEDGLLYIGSEAGAVVIDDAVVLRKGRLRPGQMLSADTTTGVLRLDREIKEALAREQPYRRWIDNHTIALKHLVSHEPVVLEEDIEPLRMSRLQVAHGITAEDLEMVFPPMIKGAQEAVYSMGDDIPLAVLSTQPRLLFTYFKQLFAQVTNPPIDPIREWAVMSVKAGLGAEHNLLEETPEHAAIVSLESAVLSEAELEKIRHLGEFGFPAVELDATWPATDGAVGLRPRIKQLCAEAEQAVDSGAHIVIVSDRAMAPGRVTIPALLITGALHQHLIRAGKRMRTSIVVVSGEVRDTHQLACMFGFGGTAVCPYLGYSTVRELVRRDAGKGRLGDDMSPGRAMENYRKALEKGLLKIMSKMGISVLNSYQGAQIFEAIGLGNEVIDTCFTGTHSKIGGIGFDEIAEESLTRHRTAWEPELAEGQTLKLGDPGYNRYRRNGERHAFTPPVLKSFHSFVKSGKADEYADYVKAQLETSPITLKDLLEFAPGQAVPVPIDEVEPVELIRRRFTTAAMSLGALSPEAHETLAIAMNRIGGKSDSGEGGEDQRRFRPYPNGDLARSRIKQIASGRFGVTAHYLVNADELEIKMAQGAKPGEGGQLPGHKVNALIARLRHTQPGVQLISPPPHHDIYSIEDLAQLIHDLKEINPRATVTVKLVAESGVGTVAAGVAKASADTILISGHDGGTGASPLSSTKHAGLPWELGVAEAQQTLLLNKLRNRVTLRTDGGLRNGRDIVIAAILGAEEFNFGTIAMIAMGCVYVRKCHLNTCPVGIATTDPKYRAKFKGSPEMVINFFNAVAAEAREIMASLGVRKLDDLIGRTSFLRQREVPAHPKANTLDLAPLLRDVVPDLAARSDLEAGTISRIRTVDRNDGIHSPALDLRIIADLKRAAGTEPGATPAEREYGDIDDPNLAAAIRTIPDSAPVELSYQVRNTNRNIGTRLSGRIAEVTGAMGLPDDSIRLQFIGTAGQSFGCFLVNGISLDLVGESNDYVGKGMSGGRIIVRTPDGVQFDPARNTIAGNTCLYGATGGRLFVNGCAGERFAVRNSGATAVIEGVGDHGCEYMTNGTVVILGLTGCNFGAGMSGGSAYVYDLDGRFQSRLNPEMVVALPVQRREYLDELHELIERHVALTNSARGREILAGWPDASARFVHVIPRDRAALEAAEKQHEDASQQRLLA